MKYFLSSIILVYIIKTLYDCFKIHNQTIREYGDITK